MALMKAEANQEFVTVCCGFDSAKGEEHAVAWGGQKVKESGVAKPVAVYAKGTFKGTLWAKFETKAQRNGMIQKLRPTPQFCEGKRIWVDECRPAVERARRSFLFALKALMIKLEYNRFALWVSEDGSSISLGHDLVASIVASPDGKAFVIKWDASWENDLKGPELDELISKANVKLATSSPGSKGAGKGKKGMRADSE